MSGGGAHSERALILAPRGRDAPVAAMILREGEIPSEICADAPALLRELVRGAAMVLATEESLRTADLAPLVDWIARQPPWSDMPFLILTERGGGLERNPAVKRLSRALGNVSFVERPFHPTTLISAAQTAVRGRRRQYEARQRIDEIRGAEALLEQRVQERTVELASANRELAAQVAEREKAEIALRQAQRLEAIGQLTSGVAHDFNNLLTVVLGNVRQLERQTDDPKVLRRLQMMGDAAERGAKLTAQLLAFSRRQKLEPKTVDLNETVGGMRDLLHSSMGGSVRIDTRLDGDLWPATIDPTQIELVILNLAINARDAMEVGGKVTIETANVTLGPPQRPEEPPAGDYVMVSVADTGSGMSPEVLAKAFEPFFTTKEVGKGSGLGLSQVYGVAAQSGGGVSIDTRPGKGTTVRVYLPRADRPVDDTRLDLAASPARADGEPLILVVDDDEAVREVTASMLEHLGYRVAQAGSGRAALEYLQGDTEIGLLLLDFAMPGMNGAELAQEIKARRPDLPVIFATGYADTAALGEVGEDRLLLKPVRENELAEKLANALGSPARPRSRARGVEARPCPA